MKRAMISYAAALFAASTFAVGAHAAGSTLAVHSVVAASMKQVHAATAKSAHMAVSKPTHAAAVAPVKAKHIRMLLSPRRVEEIQAGLDGAGAAVPLDGIWGPKTAMALRSFQKDHGLRVTGHLDAATMRRLKVPHWS